VVTIASSYLEAHCFDLDTVTAYAVRIFRGLYDFLEANDDIIGIIKPFYISFSSPFHQ
jgi:hypothetical protein